MIWFARLKRYAGFTGPVEIEVQGLPAGVSATPVTIPGGMNHCAIILSADSNAEIDASLVKVMGRSTVKDSRGDELELVRQGRVFCEQQSSGGSQQRFPISTQIVGITKPLDITNFTASPAQVTLKKGEKVEIDIHLERSESFKDAVTLAMSFDYFASKLGEQLPPGVTMDAKSTSRLTGETLDGKIILAATDKALAVEKLPIAVIARVSITFSITTNYCSNPVLLTVE